MSGNEFKVIFTLVDNMSKQLAGTSTQLSKFGQQCDTVMKSVAAFGGAMAGVFALNQLKSMMTGAMDFGASIHDMANKVGMSTTEFQKMD